MKYSIYLFSLFIIVFAGMMSGCGNKNFRKACKYSDEIWAIIPETEKEIFDDLSNEDAMSTYTLVEKKWSDDVNRWYSVDIDQRNTVLHPSPDETLLNSATSAKYLSMNDDSEFHGTHIMAICFAGYYSNMYKKTREQKYLDKILVIADHLRQNRDYIPARISELRTFLVYLHTLLMISEEDLKVKGYNKQKLNDLYIKMQIHYQTCTH